MLMAMFTGHLLKVKQHVLFTGPGKLKSIQDGGVGKEVTIFLYIKHFFKKGHN